MSDENIKRAVDSHPCKYSSTLQRSTKVFLFVYCVCALSAWKSHQFSNSFPLDANESYFAAVLFPGIPVVMQKRCAICWKFVETSNFISQKSQLTFADLADIL